MTGDDQQRFTAVIAALDVVYLAAANPLRIKAFREGLMDLSIDAIEYGAKQAMKGERRYPSIAIIREWASKFSMDRLADLSRPALPEHVAVKPEEMLAILSESDRKFGTKLVDKYRKGLIK